MKIKKSPLAVLVTALLSSSVLFATTPDLANTNIEVMPIPNASNFKISDFNIQYATLSGDGKTVVLSYTDGDYNDVILSGNFFSNVKILPKTGGRGWHLPVSISEDAKLIAIPPFSYFERNGNDWTHIEPDIQNGSEVLQSLTGSGLFLKYIKNSSGRFWQLVEPKTGKVIRSKKIEGYLNPGSISHDGSIFVDFTLRTIHYGDNWEKSKKLAEGDFVGSEDLYSTDRFSQVSPDGSVVMLSGQDNFVYSSKDDYSEPTKLTKQIGENENLDKSTYLYASNWDGSIIAGGVGLITYEHTYDKANINIRPTIWFGEKWSKIRELPTLGGKETDNGLVTSMSYDGGLLAGMSTNSEGIYEFTLWRIPELRKEVPEAPVTIISPEMTKQSIATVANDSFKALEFQRYGLISLLNGCDVEKGQGHYCVSLRTGLSGQGKSKDARVGFSSAYQLTDNLSIGLVLDHSVYNRLQSSYKNSSNNIGAGLYAQWKYKTENSEFYIRPAVSYNSYKVSVKRDAKAGVEYGEGKTRLTGLMYSLTLGQEFKLSEDKLGWFLGLRHSRGVQKGFTDSAVGFPIRYDDVEYKDTSLFAGVNVNKALTEKLSWISSLEVEQRVHQDNPSFRAENTHLGKVNLEHKMPKTALTLASGVEYKLNDTFRVSLMPSVSKANSSQLSWNVGLNFSGQF